MAFKAKLVDFLRFNEAGEITVPDGALALNKAKGLPVQVAWDVSEVIDSLGTHLQRYAQERLKLIKLHGEEIESDRWQVKPESLTEFVAAHDELLNVEVDLPGEKIKLAALGEKVEGVTPADLKDCKFFVER